MALTQPWIDHFFVGLLQQRCSVITDSSTGDTIIVDGGDEPQRIIDWVDAFEGPGPNWTTGPQPSEADGFVKRKVVALVNTHAHFDHSGFIPVLREHYGVDWYLHPDDNFCKVSLNPPAGVTALSFLIQRLLTKPSKEGSLTTLEVWNSRCCTPPVTHSEVVVC